MPYQLSPVTRTGAWLIVKRVPAPTVAIVVWAVPGRARMPSDEIASTVLPTWNRGLSAGCSGAAVRLPLIVQPSTRDWVRI